MFSRVGTQKHNLHFYYIDKALWKHLLQVSDKRLFLFSIANHFILNIKCQSSFIWILKQKILPEFDSSVPFCWTVSLQKTKKLIEEHVFKKIISILIHYKRNHCIIIVIMYLSFCLLRRTLRTPGSWSPSSCSCPRLRDLALARLSSSSSE